MLGAPGGPQKSEASPQLVGRDKSSGYIRLRPLLGGNTLSVPPVEKKRPTICSRSNNATSGLKKVFKGTTFFLGGTRGRFLLAEPPLCGETICLEKVGWTRIPLPNLQALTWLYPRSPNFGPILDLDRSFHLLDCDKSYRCRP